MIFSSGLIKHLFVEVKITKNILYKFHMGVSTECDGDNIWGYIACLDFF